MRPVSISPDSKKKAAFNEKVTLDYSNNMLLSLKHSTPNRY